ncbi:MAG: hypothetical protein JNK67_05205 [Alphaproteobacteria bacterium]|nr:hypothetical protein [Alphaproteobacteria bacterium]
MTSDRLGIGRRIHLITATTALGICVLVGAVDLGKHSASLNDAIESFLRAVRAA